MKRLTINNINTPEYHTQWYQPYLEREINLYIDIERQEVLTKKFKGGKLLDLGCGILGLCVNTKKKFLNSEIWGLDFVSNVIEKVKREYPEVNYILGDCRNLPFKDEYFDYITAGELIEHFENPEEFLKEIFRVLKKGGTFALSTPIIYEDPAHIWEFNKDDLIKLLRRYGQTEVLQFKNNTLIAYCHYEK